MNELTKALQFEEKSHRYTVGGVTLPSVTEIISPLTYSKYSVSNNVLEQAARRGTMVHELTADYDLDVLEETIDMAFAPYIQAWKAFCHDYQPQMEYIEIPLAGETINGIKFAGTVDRICKIDGERVVIDIKTYGGAMSREQKIATAVQLCGYGILARNNDLEGNYGYSRYVHLKKDGTYDTKTVAEIDEAYPSEDGDFPTYKAFHKLAALIKYAKGYK